jgi:Flp pilus assembly pilin Flp
MGSRRALPCVWHRRLAAARRSATADEGQALIEYALILALIALLTIGVLQALGQSVSGVLNHMSTSISAVSNP